MADKPRVKAPRQRTAPRVADPDRKRRLLMLGGGTVAALVAVVVLVVVLGIGGGEPSPAEVRAKLEAAGCTLVAKKAQTTAHTLAADETADWNTDPPTSGPHFGFNPDGTVGTVYWGAYTEPVQLARVVHNLEHGGVYIFYGGKVSKATLEQLNEFYDKHQRGTLMAPYPKLGKKIALGAWNFEGEAGKGYLAKCSKFDDEAFSAFFEGFQFKGVERFPESSLLPGRN